MEFVRLRRALKDFQKGCVGVLPAAGQREVESNIQKLEAFASGQVGSGTDLRDWIAGSTQGPRADQVESPLCWCIWLLRSARLARRVLELAAGGDGEGALQRAYEEVLAPHHSLAAQALFWAAAKVCATPDNRGLSTPLGDVCVRAERALSAVVEK